jgi:hypothetical protein
VPVGTSVAITVDGVVAAVTATTATPYGVSIAHALLWPGAVHGSDNDIGMYVLDGPADAPNLRTLEVTARPE